MYISKAKKYRDQGDGTAIAYDYYRLTKSYIDKDGKTKHRSVLCLGELPGFDKDERNRLASMLTTMIEDGQSVMCVMKKNNLVHFYYLLQHQILDGCTIHESA